MLVNHLRENLASFDQAISYRLFSLNRRYNPKMKYLKALEYSCNGILWLMVIAICFYMSTRPQNEIYAKLLVGLVIDIIYVAISKATFRRVRPSYARQDDTLMIAMDKLSFPSGHASRAVYLAFFFGETWFAPLFWLWAIAVITSRVLYGRHFLGDILGGSVLGYLNFITQFTIFYPLHSFLMWFLMNIITSPSTDDFGDY